MESWKDDGWLEQCCASLAEQLRIAQAENAELQQEVEALRGESSSEQSSPMAWDGTRQGSANFEAALEMETSSQGSRGSRLSRVSCQILYSCSVSALTTTGRMHVHSFDKWHGDHLI